MKVRAERAGPTVIVHLDGGRLVVEEDMQELHDLVRTVTCLDDGCSVVLDLGKVWQLDCAGIGQLVELGARSASWAASSRWSTWDPGRSVSWVMLGLLRVLPVFASREEAITACWSAKARSGVTPFPRIEAPLLAVRPSIDGALRGSSLEVGDHDER